MNGCYHQPACRTDQIVRLFFFLCILFGIWMVHMHLLAFLLYFSWMYLERGVGYIIMLFGKNLFLGIRVIFFWRD